MKQIENEQATLSSTASPPLEGIGERLRLRRVARGWSLEALASEMGGLVSRQALHKYEKGAAKPTPRVLVQLAKALGVPSAHLAFAAPTRVSFVAYRMTRGLGKAQQEEIEARVTLEAQDRVRLQELLGQEFDAPELTLIATLEDAERAAQELREIWNLGLDAICSLSTVLEDHGIHIIEVEAGDKFDGLSARIHDGDAQEVAATVIVRRDTPGDRWRLTLAHELAHLLLRFASDASAEFQEKAAFRFGAAFLAPRRLMENEFGFKRQRVSLEELFLLKPRLGLSAQALAYRLKDLEIISEQEMSALFAAFTARGWRKEEPEPLEREQPTWLRRGVYHALAEGLIAQEDAARLLGKTFDESTAPARSAQSQRLQALKRLPLEERRRVLAANSQAAGDQFEGDPEWKAWEAATDPVEWAADTSVKSESAAFEEAK